MEAIFNFLVRLIYTLSNPEIIPYVLGAYLFLFFLVFILRCIVYGGTQKKYLSFKSNAKPINTRADLDKVRPKLLKNIVTDYISIAEKNTSAVNIGAIIRKYMLKFSFIGWSFDSMQRFILNLEIMLPIMGLALAVIFSGFEDYLIVFGVTAVAVFVCTRLIAGLLDFQLFSSKLAAEIEEYVQREVGQFYAGDFGTVLLRFKSEVSSSLKTQADTLSDGIKNLEENLSSAIRLTMTEISKEMSGIGTVLNKPLEDWAEVLGSSAEAQAKNIETMGKFEDITKELQSSAEGLDKVLKTHISSLGEELAKVSEHIDVLSLSGKELKESSDSYKESVAVLEGQIKYIEKNQSMLQDALGHYESSLESMTQKMGDGFGSIVDFHIAGAYQSLGTSLQNNVSKITSTNQELITRLSKLFEQLAEQSRNETSAIVNMNDQMNLRFEALDSKLL